MKNYILFSVRIFKRAITQPVVGFCIAMIAYHPVFYAQCIQMIDVGIEDCAGGSLVEVNGNPAMAYWDYSDGDLKYVRAIDANGSIWPSPQLLDVFGSNSENPSIAIVNGNPAIAYYDNSNGDLKYVRALDPNGTSWGSPMIVDADGDVGNHPSMTVINGHPAISYLDYPNGDLKYIRALNPNGTSWGDPMVVDADGDVGYDPSMIVVNGHPAIAYLDWGNRDLKYIRASNPDGTGWEDPQVIDWWGWVGSHPSMTVVNGNPAIAYRDFGIDVLKYVRASDPDGTWWGSPQVIDEESNRPWVPSLRVINGKPAVSYTDYFATVIKYLPAIDADGTAWPETPFSLDIAGDMAFMEIINGSPAIGFHGGSNMYFTNFFAENTAYNALDFDGVDDFAATGTVYTTQEEQITMEGWVQWDGESEGYWGNIFYNGESALDGYGLYLNDTTAEGELTIIIGNKIGYNTGVFLSPDEWTHLALVRDGWEWKLYVNGEDQNIGLYNDPNPPSTGFFLGGRPGYGGDYFSGALAHVRLWNVARTQVEIQASMYSAPAPDAPGLVCRYEMHQDNCGPFLAETYGGLNATMYGAVGTLPQFFTAGELTGTQWIHSKIAGGLTVFPNPSDGRLEFTGGEVAGAQLRIADLTGRIVKTQMLTGNAADISDLPGGLYFLSLYREEQQYVAMKIVKE